MSKVISLRSTMPALANKGYFNYGGQGPLPRPSLEAIIESWESIQELGPFTNKVWPYVMSEINATKEKLAKISGVSTNQIALTENVTSGCVLPLWGLPFKEGERLLISDCEHPGVVSACKEIARRKRLYIDILPVRQIRNRAGEKDKGKESFLDILETSLKSNTKLVAISHILWNTGIVMPIESIAKRLHAHINKPFLLVDAAQSFGQLPVEHAASASDIYAFTGHKWACGPEGLGAVVISRRVLEESNPTLIGWKSLKNEQSIYEESYNPFHSDARRFEIATSCIPLLAGLRSSLDLFDKEGSVGQRLEKILKLSEELWVALQRIDGVELVLNSPPPSGLISFSVSSKFSANKIVQRLGEKKLWIRLLEDPKWLRACVHITTGKNEIKNLSESIYKLTKG